jgi:ABC-2 type transport system ATP-binding protein
VPADRPLLAADHVAYAYGRGRDAIADAGFALTGPAVGVLGPAGAGKSTLLALLTGARRPTGGRLRVGGLDPADPDQRRVLRSRVGVLTEGLAADPWHTVGDFLGYVGWLRGIPRAALPGAIEACLLATDLTQLRGRRVRTLTAGMRQRVLLAQALINRPALVVLDAPAVVLDSDQRPQFLARLAALRGRCAVVLATPLVENVAAVCDEVVVLADGRTVFSGRTAELAGGEVTPAAVAAGYVRVLDEARAARPG